MESGNVYKNGVSKGPGSLRARRRWGRHLFEEERKAFGDDSWPHGVKKNRANLERFMGYSIDQGLMERKLEVEELFAAATLDS